ncbi:hypothetical protein M3Y97_01128900 [Aphelenchoides bicaudatus]|nr:hypothetical protein M3Y97_01128900 [Aphelenchoides bicaudatus]
MSKIITSTGVAHVHEKFDYIPLVIDVVFLSLFVIAMAIVEVLLRKGILGKEEARGPTKIHLQHLKVYQEQEVVFLENGGQANKIREPIQSSSMIPENKEPIPVQN